MIFIIILCTVPHIPDILISHVYVRPQGDGPGDCGPGGRDPGGGGPGGVVQGVVIQGVVVQVCNYTPV